MNQNLHQNRSRVVVSMGYDNITTSIDLATGYGAILPDPSIVGSYDLECVNLAGNGQLLGILSEYYQNTRRYNYAI
jgi:hypothetical protein